MLEQQQCILAGQTAPLLKWRNIGSKHLRFRNSTAGAFKTAAVASYVKLLEKFMKFG